MAIMFGQMSDLPPTLVRFERGPNHPSSRWLERMPSIHLRASLVTRSSPRT